MFIPLEGPVSAPRPSPQELAISDLQDSHIVHLNCALLPTHNSATQVFSANNAASQICVSLHTVIDIISADSTSVASVWAEVHLLQAFSYKEFGDLINSQGRCAKHKPNLIGLISQNK